MSARSKLFVGSSDEARKNGALGLLVQALETDLSDIEIVSWDESHQWLHLKTALDSLNEALIEYSYAVFLAFPDDLTTIRGVEYYSPRDNVIFEFGLFVSQLGRERTFLVATESKFSDGKGLRIFSDIAGAFRAGTYVLDSPITATQAAIRYDLADLVERIKSIELGRTPANADKALAELKKCTNKLSHELLTEDKVDSYYTGKVRGNIEDLIRHKAVATRKDVRNAAKDVALYFGQVPDLCDVGQLAEIQSHSRGLTEVWVFAEDPLEFLNKTGDRDFEALRQTIVENLRHEVKYVYFVPSSFNINEVNNLENGTGVASGEWQGLKRHISIILVDPRLFKTYFTLHFVENRRVKSVYMSSVMQDRKDLLIQVSDTERADKIYKCIRALGQNRYDKFGVNTLDLMAVR